MVELSQHQLSQGRKGIERERYCEYVSDQVCSFNVKVGCHAAKDNSHWNNINYALHSTRFLLPPENSSYINMLRKKKERKEKGEKCKSQICGIKVDVKV